MNCRSLLPIVALSLVLLVGGCASGYKEFYTPAQGATSEKIAELRVAPPPTTPIVERAQPTDGKTVMDAYLKRGYAVLGSSMFNSGQAVSEDAAILQGKEVGADLVLILNPTYTGSVTASVPIATPTTSTSYSTGSATVYGANGSVTAYGSGTTTTHGTKTTYIPMTVHRSDYGAVFFVKRRFELGVGTRDLNDSERQALQSNKGAVVGMVVDGTPAFDADILVGDVLTTIDGLVIQNADSFIALQHERRGKHVALSILRRGQRIEKIVPLNP